MSAPHSPAPRMMPLRLARAALLASLLGVSALAADPVVKWAPLTGLSDLQRVQMEHLRKSRCLPEASEVDMPVYPGAVAIGLGWGRVKPACAARSGWQDLGRIVLVSADARQQVEAWYDGQLGSGYTRHAAVRGPVFLRADVVDFLWERDYYKYPNVTIRDAPAAWLAVGYATLIELNRPGPPDQSGGEQQPAAR